jgi:hypothetical protein
MIDKRTLIDQIEVTRAGPVLVRFAIELFDTDTGQALASSWHRTSIAPGDDPDAAIAAVNADITVRPSLMAAPVSGDLVTKLDNIVNTVHTPAVVKAFQDAQAAALAALSPPA